MTVLRADGMTWSDDEDENDYLKTCPIIGFMPVGNIDSAGNETGDFPDDNLLNAYTHLRWACGDTGDDVFLTTFDLDTDLRTNFVAFAIHNFSGCIISVFGQINDSPGDFNLIFQEQTVPNNDPLILEFQEDGYNAITVRIQRNDGPSERSAAIMYCGKLLRMSRGVKYDSDHPVITRNKKSDIIAGYSETGQFMGRLTRNEIKESKFEFSNVPDTDMQDSFFLPWFLRDWIPETPFFIAWAPNDYEHDVGFVWTTADMQPLQNPITRRWSLTFQVRGFGKASL